MAGLHLNPRGRVLPVAVLTQHDRAVTPDIVLRMGQPPWQRGTALQMVLVWGTTKRALLEGQTLKLKGECHPSVLMYPSQTGLSHHYSNSVQRNVMYTMLVANIRRGSGGIITHQ